MTTTDIDPIAHLAALEDAIRHGDTTVTPAQLDKARVAAQHASLLAEADEHRAEREAAEALEARRAGIREEHLGPLGDHLDAARAAYAAAVAALGDLDRAIGCYKDARKTAHAAAKTAGIADEVTHPELAPAAHYCDLALAEGLHRFQTKGTAAISSSRPTVPADRGRKLVRHPLHSTDYADRVDADLAAAHQARQDRAHAAYLAKHGTQDHPEDAA